MGTMQTTGYLIINSEKILVLVRPTTYGRSFKIRKSGKDGARFDEEERYLKDHPILVDDLKRDFIVKL